MATPKLKIIPTSPAWEFTVQAVKTSAGSRAVGIRVAPGMPLAVVSAKSARRIAKQLNDAADGADGSFALPVLGPLDVGL